MDGRIFDGIFGAFVTVGIIIGLAIAGAIWGIVVLVRHLGISIHWH